MKIDNSYWDTMTGTNSSNDRLMLRENVEIYFNEYFSYNIFFWEINHPRQGLEAIYNGL